jgi:hypothetical protein
MFARALIDHIEQQVLTRFVDTARHRPLDDDCLSHNRLMRVGISDGVAERVRRFMNSSLLAVSMGCNSAYGLLFILLAMRCSVMVAQQQPWPPPGAGDANGLRYQAAVGGSVPRTQQDKNQEVVSVRDFGADPTGTNSSVTAFQTCINRGQIPPNTSVQCYVPAGTWYLPTSPFLRPGLAATWVVDAAANFTGSGSLPGTTFNYSSGNASGTVTNVTCGSFGVSWLTCSFGGSSSTTPVLTLNSATGQTPGLVIGTCGGATSFGPCALTSAELPLSAMGTIGGGTWQGTVIATTYGGLGSATAGAYSVWGNASSSSATPSYTSAPNVSSVTLQGATSGSCPITVAATGGTATVCGAFTVSTSGAIGMAGGSVGPISNYSAEGSGTIGTANATTYYLWPGGTSPTLANSTSKPGVPVPAGCTARNLYVSAGTGPTSAGGTVTLYHNGTAAALTCTLSSGSNVNCSDTTHTVSFGAGALWAIGVLTTQASDTTANVTASFQCQ